MIREEITINDARLLIWELTESIEELLEQLELTELAAFEYKKIKSTKRKLEYLGVRIAINKLLNENISIIYDADGKPSVEAGNWQISISHSNKWIAVMAHPTRPVGIDIECPSDKIRNLYTRFLNKTEQVELSDGTDIRKFQLAWSAKEALYKIIGKQAVDFAQQLHIFPFELMNKGRLTAQHIPTKKLYQLSYIQSSAFTLVYCLA